MGVKAAARLFVFVATAAVLSAAVTWRPMPAAAASPGTLFGLNFYAGEVAKLDPSTGQYTTFTQLPVDPSGIVPPGFYGLASDPGDHKLFTIRATYNDPTFQTQLWQVVTINTTTGATTVGPALSQSFTAGLLAEWAFDPSTGDLFGVISPMVGPQVVKVDPITGVVTDVADLPGTFVSGVAFAPDRHDLFVFSQDQSNPFQVVWSVLKVDTITGNVSNSGPLSTSLSALTYDSSSGTLFGVGFSSPTNTIFRVDATSGGETPIGPALGCCVNGITVDSASHTIFLTDTEFSGSGLSQSIESVNDETGAYSVSAGPIGPGQPVFNLVFEGVAAPTPASVRAEVVQGFASGAITNQGVENALLHQLDAAAASRARGQCGAAANIYGAMIDTVRALSGGGQVASGARTSAAAGVSQKIDPALAAHLISDVQYLIGHCP